MINTTFNNDPNFPNEFLQFWSEYRAIPAGRPEEMLKRMTFFHNTLYPDFAISECFNCGSRWKRAEDRLDLAYELVKTFGVAPNELKSESDAEISNSEESSPEVTKKTKKTNL